MLFSADIADAHRLLTVFTVDTLEARWTVALVGVSHWNALSSVLTRLFEAFVIITVGNVHSFQRLIQQLQRSLVYDDLQNHSRLTHIGHGDLGYNNRYRVTNIIYLSILKLGVSWVLKYSTDA